ncbi:MAG: hypothetical protein JNL11_00765 [Bdellovibrionaceae bacterium]|nr:hypothetical protein [Pseudobdellovibrionaceae bacterium]
MTTTFVLFFVSVFALSVHAKSVSGTVTVDKGLEKSLKGGVLFVFAKKVGSKAGDGQMPVAVQRIVDPKFPVHFELNATNAMVQGTPFEGPFSISARYSAGGNATDKSGPEGSTPIDKPIKVGETAVLIELKKK